MNRLAKLIIIRGNSGSGKTSVSKALQEKFGENTMLISQDMIRREILYTKDGAGTKALPLMTELLKYGRHNSAGHDTGGNYGCGVVYAVV